MFIFISIKMTSFDEKIFNAVSDMANIANNPFKDKWVSILGDSISTFANYIPEENTTYYPAGDVNLEFKTWWHILLTKLGAKLCVNNSYGGRKVCGDADADVKNAVNKLHRVAGQKYINLDGKYETATEDVQPDIILVLLGTNDFNAGVTLGSLEMKYLGTSNFTTDFYKSYNCLLVSLIINYPKTQIYCLDGIYDGNFNFIGTNSAGNRQPEFINAIIEIAKFTTVHCLHPYNICVTDVTKDEYMIDKLHPNAKMMKMIANQCYREMLANNCL